VTSFSEELASLVDDEQRAELELIAAPATIAVIHKAAVEDNEYTGLIEQIRAGWPDSPADVASYLRSYFTFADELSVSNGLVYKGHRLVVPQPARTYVLNRLHKAHSGVNACQRRARETVYWPGITADIKRLVEACATCAAHQTSQQKEPLLPYPAPARPWEVVGVDIFTFADYDYLITVDYLTGWFEVDRLQSKAVSNIVHCLKQHFARHGLPLRVISDNNPFNSREFRIFSENYEFEHTTSSPRYSQSNGRAENAVKIAKRIMSKATETRTGPFLALLEWRNTPSE
jgi:transposase InsO family protein